ncbi:MAG: AAA family ATPase, partial [Clostridia bacterium]|nr:AAA family ATPase [Clostridia bacterium]
MICERVGYFNFRNIIDQTLYFSSGLNIICGNNAQGKTNALEGIWVCSSGKSHRASKDSEMIRFDNTEALIGLDFRDNSRIGNIEVKLYSNGQKVCKIDGFSVRKRSEFIGKFKSVLFTPENLSIVKEGPSERRLFLDNALCLLYSSYISNLQDYNRILKQRNRMLAEHAEEKINLKEDRDLLNEFEIWS